MRDAAGGGGKGGRPVRPVLIMRNNFQMRNAQFNNFMCERGNFLSGTANCLCECDKTLATSRVCVREREGERERQSVPHTGINMM